MPRIGWVGLGRIGKPMAEALARDGFDLSAFDIAPTTSETFSGPRARLGTSAADVAKDADIVLLCVTDGSAVEQVVFGGKGVISLARPGTLLIDHSTIHPDQTRLFAKRAAEQGISWVDAPISGGPKSVETRSLTAWLGGQVSHCERAKDLVQTYCSKIHYMGPSGTGLVAKLCNQAIVTNTIAVWAEMLQYAKCQDLDLPALIGSLANSAADSPVRQTFAQDIALGRFPDLSARNMIKELQIITEIAAAHKISLAHSELSLQAFKEGIAQCFAAPKTIT